MGTFRSRYCWITTVDYEHPLHGRAHFHSSTREKVTTFFQRETVIQENNGTHGKLIHDHIAESESMLVEDLLALRDILLNSFCAIHEDGQRDGQRENNSF